MQTDEYQLELGWKGDDGLGIDSFNKCLIGERQRPVAQKYVY